MQEDKRAVIREQKFELTEEYPQKPGETALRISLYLSHSLRQFQRGRRSLHNMDSARSSLV